MCVYFTVQKREEYSNQVITFVGFPKPEFIILMVVFIALRKNASTSPSAKLACCCCVLHAVQHCITEKKACN